MAEEIPSSKRRKIEETVLNILKDADLETATESSVRTTASQQLDTDFSDLASKIFIRQVVESFLLSNAPSTTSPDHAGNNNKVSVPEDTKAPSTTTPGDAGNKKVSVPEGTKLGEVGKKDPEFGRHICNLSNKTKVEILYLENGKPLVSIRSYVKHDGELVPSNRGIHLTDRQWGVFRSNISSIERGIARMKSKIMRSAALKDAALQGSMEVVAQNQMGTDIQDPINYVGTQSDTMEKGKHEMLLDSSVDLSTTSSSAHQIAVGGLQGSTGAVAQNQMETDIQDPINYAGTQSDTMEKGKHEMLDSSVDLPTTSSSAHQIVVGGLQSQADTCPSRQGWHLPNNELASSVQSLIPITTTRFNGENYHCWSHQMEFFLKQLNVAYVLTDSCPSTTSLEENTGAEVAAKKWVNDEYICRRNILNSLSDDLFQHYSKKKSYSAKEVWEELKSDYSEEFGRVRSEVNEYIHFEMVDGISVVQQVEELNDIAKSITKSGIGIDENFQASVIISKLPPSWKEYRAKLMHCEFLSVNRLLDLLKLEEESRNQRKKENP